MIKDKKGNTVTIQGSDGTVYTKGTSQYIIKVENYITSADTTKATKVTKWSGLSQSMTSQLK